jgi:putative two-component system response regulator
VGAVDFLAEPFHGDLVRARIDVQFELKRHKDHLQALVDQQTAETLRTQEATLIAIAALAETRDPETGGHLHRTQQYVRLVAEELGADPRFAPLLSPEAIDLLFKSAPLHDVGKVGISDRVLLKPGRLTPEEFAEVKKHTLYGWNALKSANRHMGRESFLRCAAEIALTHHERWDGSGYPHGLKGERIPLSGRLMAIADVYDALISRRVYKSPLSHGDAVRIIAEDSGRHFDPAVVDAFLRGESRVRAVALEMEEYVI